MKYKSDWTHACSLNYDTDGNYLVSFYNIGQVWKIDAHTGKLLWKFGRNGDFSLPSACSFTQAHAVHINRLGSLMFFDNGTVKKQPEIFALNLNEPAKTANLAMHFVLPSEVFTERMDVALT